MPNSGPTPIEFNAKLYYIAGALAMLLAVTSVLFAVVGHHAFGLLVGAFWAVVSALAFRAGRNSPS